MYVPWWLSGIIVILMNPIALDESAIALLCAARIRLLHTDLAVISNVLGSSRC